MSDHQTTLRIHNDTVTVQMYILSSNDRDMEDWQGGSFTIEAPGVLGFFLFHGFGI